MTNSRVERSHLIHWATVWDYAGLRMDGTPKVSAEPYEIRCRWVPRRGQTIGADSNPLAFDAELVLIEDVQERSIMRLGRLADLPDDPDNLFEVLTSDSADDLKGRAVSRSLTLGRYTATLPVGA